MSPDRLFGSLTLAIATSAMAGSVITAPPPEEIVPGVHLLRGQMLPERGPDGNTIVFEAPQGFVVVDTGRHEWHSDAILALAPAERKPIVAIVNTHWHLDHSSGNGRIKAAFPQAQVYATKAINRALAEGGFLARNLESARPRLQDPKLSDVQKEEVQIFVATMQARDELRPDIAIERSEGMTIGGRVLDVRVTDRAVTDADVWLFDAPSGVAVLGDLVTLPAPFFETACPAQWREELDEVSNLPFDTAIPGHGEPMTPAQFQVYRVAFNSFMDCVEGATAPAQCATAWQSDIAPLIGNDERMRKMAFEYAQYYVDMLRENGGKSAECLER